MKPSRDILDGPRNPAARLNRSRKTLLSDTPDLGPVPERVRVETAQVHRLIRDQFPQWADLPLEPVANGGWDNWTFHLGEGMVVRLPSATEYAQAVEKEHKWLPALAPRLPLPIPTPVAKGAPSPDYPHPWSVYRWIDGHTASVERIADPREFATDLAVFLAALQAVDPTEGPPARHPQLVPRRHTAHLRRQHSSRPGGPRRTHRRRLGPQSLGRSPQRSVGRRRPLVPR